MTVLLFVVILGVLVFVHELGHFLAARRAGVRVEEFGFGFPPRLFGRRRGATIYSINLIPFGGFVRLYGEQSGESVEPGSFQSISLPKKVLVMAAGVLMNYALAFVLLTGVLAAGVMVEPSTVKVDSGAVITNRQTVAVVTSGGAAEKAGVKTGDVVTSVNGQLFVSTEALVAYTRQADFPPLTMKLLRDDQPVTVIITPNATTDAAAPHYDFGVREIGTLRYPWYSAPWAGLRATVSLSWQAIVGFGQVISQLLNTGTLSQDVAGPVGIAVLTGEVSRLGLTSLVQFMALLSISLAVINFLPIPALDGGRAFFLLLQKFLRKNFNPKIETYIHAGGFYLLLLMIILISVRDVQRFELITRVKELFR